MVILQQPSSVPSILRPPHFVEAKRGFGKKVGGYLLKHANLIVLRRFERFSPAGLTVVRRSDVSELLINEKWTHMIRDEGHARLGEERFGLPTTTIRELAAALFERGRNIWIECEEETSAEYGLYVGRIVALAHAHLEVTTFDSDGHWLLGSYSIPYSSITLIEIDNPYVDTFSKYIRECPFVSPES